MLDIIFKDGHIETNYRGKSFKFITNDDITLYLIYGDEEDSNLRGISLNSFYSSDMLLEMLSNPSKFGIPCTLKHYLHTKVDSRELKVIISKAGGNASKNAISNKISLPNTWMKSMNITKDNRDVIAIFNNNEIIIKKK